jgi:queuine tRNA-ribosyltransferase/7-cyano-7-deazaguanine tRNA-ribosyltransferase
MIKFSIKKKSKKSRARLGILKTPHGEVETPALVTVATQATVKALGTEDAYLAKTKIAIANTFHLHLRPGEDIVKKHGGLHKFASWDRPLMTDSGGFQVFSLGFGKDMGISKILKQNIEGNVVKGQQPKLLSIDDDGVRFTSYLDGREVFLGPKESIKIQEKLGADIIFAFDECPPPHADEEYMKHSVARTHEWAKVCLKTKKSKQALFGIVQGGRFENLRKESAEFIGGLPFDGFGIGGELGVDKKWMFKMLQMTTDILPEAKPRHLLGNGYLEDMAAIASSGIDTFDCVVPTHHARHGTAFTSEGKIDLNRAMFLKDTGKLDPKCKCEVCQTYSRGYLCHLFKARELAAMRHLSVHNLHFFNTFMEKVRRDIQMGKI